MAIKLTESLSDIQALMFKHSEQVGTILEVAAPVLSEIPYFSGVDFFSTQNINRLIVDTTDKSRKVIDDVRQALVTCKVGHLKQYSEDLITIKLSLKESLRKQEGITNKIVNYKDLSDSLRQCLFEYTETIDSTISYLTQIERAFDKISRINFVVEKLNSIGLGTPQIFSTEVHKVLIKAQEANANLQTALNNGDIESLKNCIQGLKEVSIHVHKLSKPQE